MEPLSGIWDHTISFQPRGTFGLRHGGMTHDTGSDDEVRRDWYNKVELSHDSDRNEHDPDSNLQNSPTVAQARKPLRRGNVCTLLAVFQSPSPFST